MLIIEKVLVLRSTGIFARIRDEYLAHLARRCTEVRLGSNDVLFKQGDRGDCLYVVVQGRIRIEANGVTLAELGEGEVVGEMAALDPEPRSATVAAMSDTLLLRISNDDLNILMSGDEAIARGIITVLCQRLRNSAKAASAPQPKSSSVTHESSSVTSDQ